MTRPALINHIRSQRVLTRQMLLQHLERDRRPRSPVTSIRLLHRIVITPPDAARREQPHMPFRETTHATLQMTQADP